MRKTLGMGTAALLLALAGCSSSSGGSGSDQTFADLTTDTGTGGYTYTLTGTAETVDITMSGSGGTEQQTDVTLPFTEEGVSTDFPYISAQITDEAGGDVTCTILDAYGNEVASGTSEGFPSIVTCDE